MGLTPLVRNHSPSLSRRTFVRTGAWALLGACAGRRLAAAAGPVPAVFPGIPIIDVHQHPFLPRTTEETFRHQQNTGCAGSIMMAAPLRLGGGRDPFWAQELARRSGGRFVYCVNASSRSGDPTGDLEPFLNSDAVGIGELKEAVACDSAYIHRLADLAADHDVPLLLHFEEGNFNSGYPRFHQVIERHPKTRFIGHAQTFWAQVDAACPPNERSYPTGRVTPGGLSDRWLGDYPNFFGDLSSGSGNGFLSRDPDFAADFLRRHQDKLVYGSDCSCRTGVGPACIAATKQRLLQQLCPDPGARAKILAGNARRIYRWPRAAGPSAA